MSVRMLSHTGSFALFYPPLFLLSLSSAGLSLQDVLDVAITAESKKAVDRVSWAKRILIPAVKAVAALPLCPA